MTDDPQLIIFNNYAFEVRDPAQLESNYLNFDDSKQMKGSLGAIRLEELEKKGVLQLVSDDGQKFVLIITISGRWKIEKR